MVWAGYNDSVDVLLIIKDTNVLREGSEIRASLLEQAQLVNRLYVIVLNHRRDYFAMQKVSDSLWFLPTNSWAQWLAPFDCLRIARKELFFQGRLQVDLISAHDPCESGLAALLLNVRYAKPLHVHIEQNVFLTRFMSHSLGNALRGLIARSVVRVASGIHTTSEQIRTSIAGVDAGIAERTVVFPPFVDVEAFRSEPVRVDLHAKYPQFSFFVLIAIPLISSENLQMIMQVFSVVWKHNRRAGLVIVGDGVSQGRARMLARSHGVSDNVMIENTSENLMSYFKTADVFIMTADEDQDNLIARASANSCPVVCTAVGIAPSVIKDGDSGFICESNDAECFTKNVVKIMTDAGVRSRIRLNSSLFVQDAVGGTKEGHLKLIQESWQIALKNGTPAAPTSRVL